MRKTLALTAALLLAASSTAAVVGHNGSGGDVSITGSSSASSSTAVGPNGTEWTATVSMEDRQAVENQNGNIANVSYSGDDSTGKASFTGEIVAGTPCHVINHEVKEEGDTYILNIKTVKDELDSDRMCAQVLTGISYDASFEADKPYTVEVQHNGETVGSLEQPKAEEKSPDKKGALRKLLNWLSSLF
jgi:predicted small secreted protein